MAPDLYYGKDKHLTHVSFTLQNIIYGNNPFAWANGSDSLNSNVLDLDVKNCDSSTSKKRRRRAAPTGQGSLETEMPYTNGGDFQLVNENFSSPENLSYHGIKVSHMDDIIANDMQIAWYERWLNALHG